MTRRELDPGLRSPPPPQWTPAPRLIWAGGIGAILLLAIGLEWLAPIPAVHALPPLPLPASVLEAQAPADLAATAGANALARPIFASNRRPVAVADAGPPNLASADRVSGIILEPETSGVEQALAVMQPKDGGKPVTLHVGDRFQGKLITAIDGAGITLAGGTRVRPEFGAPPAIITGAQP